MNVITGALLILAGAVIVVVLLILITRLPVNMHQQSTPDARYLDALEASDPAQFQLPAPASSQEQLMVQRVVNLFSDYSAENIQANFSKVYAEEVYFRDAFRQFDRGDDILAYMLHGLAPLRKCEFVFADYARSGGDYYLRWTMRLNFKNAPEGQWEESAGMTHIRFNSEGQVVFHQDYWDPTDILYRRIPLVAQIIAAVKKKM